MASSGAPDLLARVTVPARLAIIVRGSGTVGYNPGANVWHRLDDDVAEVLRWLRAGRGRADMAGHLHRRHELDPPRLHTEVHELVAHGRSIPEIAEELGADYVVYQEVADLKAAILEGSDVDDLDMSCFDGRYVTGTVTEEYLDWVESSQES